MFGCCAAGRLPQTSLIQVDETHAYFELPAASSINHITVFLVGTVPFPDGFGATVHFFWPGKGFQLLGMLSNEKPSAIFRLRGTYTSTGASTNAHAAFSSTSAPVDPSAEVTAVLGLSIEPLAQVASQMSSLPSSVATSRPPLAADPTLLAERVVKHLFNYLSGFAEGGGLTPQTPVPLGAIQRWYESFLSKVKAGGIGFLERDES